MLGTFNIMLTYANGEWSAMAPFAGSTPVEEMTAGNATAGAMIIIGDNDHAKEILENLAAKIMDAVNKKGEG